MKLPSDFLDRCGVTVSGLCGIHCVALVALAVFQPIATWGGQHGAFFHALEISLILAATGLAAIALVSGYRHHGHAKPVSIGVVGLLTLWAVSTTALHDYAYAPLFTALGGLMLVVAHKWNIKCRCAHAVAHQ
jgi:hypothetical protein